MLLPGTMSEVEVQNELSPEGLDFTGTVRFTGVCAQALLVILRFRILHSCIFLQDSVDGLSSAPAPEPTSEESSPYDPEEIRTSGQAIDTEDVQYVEDGGKTPVESLQQIRTTVDQNIIEFVLKEQVEQDMSLPPAGESNEIPRNKRKILVCKFGFPFVW